jgi:hypothetical protein
MPEAVFPLNLKGRCGLAPALMAWFWAVNLVFFPTWWFASTEPARRLQALIAVLLWIAASVLGLWLWLRFEASSSSSEWRAPAPDSRQTKFLYLWVLVLGLINLIPTTYSLTYSGDEAHHAGTFRTIGRGLADLLERTLPGSPALWLVLGMIALVAAGFAWWVLVKTRHRILVLTSTGGVLVVSILVAALLLSENMERVTSTALTSHRNPIALNVLVRFPPLSKFLWLPVGVCCWQSVFALRLPVLVCWLLSGLVLHRVVSLRERSFMALLPALYLLTLPGMFYYAHVIYLTTPMLLAWCVGLYFYECYRISGERRYLIWTALGLNVGMLVRRETGYFALGVLTHWAWVQWRSKKLGKETLLDVAGLTWFGLSFVPLWSYVAPHRPFIFDRMNLLDPSRLLAIANDYPYHIGPIASLVLLFAVGMLLWRRGKSNYSPSLLGLSGLTIGILYFLYTIDWIVPDERMIGVFALGREWQTENRFLVSWSPFVAILLAEGISRFPRSIWRPALGIGLALLLLAQATVWSPPMLLPEYTSLRLQPGSERPHWPDAQVVTFVSQELATPQTRIYLHKHLAAGYYLNSLSVQGVWLREGWTFENAEEFADYCDSQGVSLVVLPAGKEAQAVQSDEHFRVRRIFEHLDQPAIVVAEYLGRQRE